MGVRFVGRRAPLVAVALLLAYSCVADARLLLRDDESSSGYDGDLPDCVVRTDSLSFVGKEGAEPAGPTNSIIKCEAACFEDYDIMVWENRRSRCLCWKAEDGEWEENEKARVYDIRPCRGEETDMRVPATEMLTPATTTMLGASRSTADVPPNQFTFPTRDGAGSSAGAQNPAPAVVGSPARAPFQFTRPSISSPPPAAAVPPNQFTLPSRAGEAKFTAPAAVPPNQFTLPGMMSPSGSAGGMMPTFSQPAPIPPAETGSYQSLAGKACIAGVSSTWDDYFKAGCIGDNQKTISVGYLIFERPLTGLLPEVRPYDGSLVACKYLFELKAEGRLVNQDIFLGTDSWLTWDSTTRACKIYETSASCNVLEYSPTTAGKISSRFCPRVATK